MTIRLFFLFLFWVLGVDIFAQNSIPEHFKYFGFSVVDCLWDDPNDMSSTTNYLSEIEDFSNIAQLCVFAPNQDVSAQIAAMNTVCVQPLLAIQSVLFELENENAPSGENWKLATNYISNWDTFKTLHNGFLIPERIAAFYLIDEPFWNGITAEELAIACNLVKGDFPDIATCTIEAHPIVDELVIPATLDWIGFDRYGIQDVTTDPTFLADLATVKNARVSSDQKIILISDTQWLSYYADFGILPEDMQAVSENYFELALSDPDIIGIIGYLWPGGLDGEGHLGLRNLPDNVQQANRTFGEAVIFQNSGCVDNLPKFIRAAPLMLYPNPSFGNFTLENKTPFEAVRISDPSGRLVYELQQAPSTKIQISPNLAPGWYVAQVLTGHGGWISQRFLVR